MIKLNEIILDENDRQLDTNIETIVLISKAISYAEYYTLLKYHQSIKDELSIIERNKCLHDHIEMEKLYKAIYEMPIEISPKNEKELTDC